MKSVKNNKFEQNTLDALQLKSIKGGTGTITLETIIEITCLTPAGTTEMLYCDRRRKKVG